MCLTNLESLNAILIRDGIPQSVRIEKLNDAAIYQMNILTEDKRVEDINTILENENVHT